MGFMTQIAVLFFAGIFSAWIYSRKLRKRNKDWNQFLWMLWDGAIIVWGLLLYFNVIPIATLVNWIPWVHVANGNDWMWNSFQLLGIDFGIVGTATMDPIACILFLCYPAIYHFGGDVGRMLYGRRSTEGGLWWALEPLHKPQSVKDAEKAAKKAKQQSM